MYYIPIIIVIFYLLSCENHTSTNSHDSIPIDSVNQDTIIVIQNDTSEVLLDSSFVFSNGKIIYTKNNSAYIFYLRNSISENLYDYLDNEAVGDNYFWSPDGHIIIYNALTSLIIYKEDKSHIIIRKRYKVINWNPIYPDQLLITHGSGTSQNYGLSLISVDSLDNSSYPYLPINSKKGKFFEGDSIYFFESNMASWHKDGKRIYIKGTLELTNSKKNIYLYNIEEDSIEKKVLDNFSLPDNYINLIKNDNMLFIKGDSIFYMSLNDQIPIKLTTGTKPNWSNHPDWISFTYENKVYVMNIKYPLKKYLINIHSDFHDMKLYINL